MTVQPNLTKNIINVGIVELSGGHSGMQFYDLGLLKGLAGQVNSVHLFSSKIPISNQPDNIFIYNSFDKIWSTRNQLIRLIRYLPTIIMVLSTISKKKCNVIHFHQFHFTFLFVLNAFLFKILGKKLVLTLHDIETFDIRKKKIPFLERMVYSLINHFIVHNQYSHHKFLEKLGYSSISIIKHGNYVPFVQRVQRNLIFDKFRILFFGQIKKVKGLDILLEALGKLKQESNDFELLIAGRIWKDDFAYYQKIIDDYRLNEYVKQDLRFIPDEELFEVFEKCNLVVLPYKSIYQSGVLLKAMSYGRSVLCSDLPPFQEMIVDTRNGFIFKTENSEDLASKLSFIMNNKDILEEVEDEGCRYVSHYYDWVDIGSETKKLYCKVLNFDNS